MKLGQGQCKIVCVLGKRWLLLGKNQDMEILIEKEYLLILRILIYAKEL